MLTLIPLKNLKRETRFPYPVETAGYVHYYRTTPEDYCYRKLEVCLRLASESKFAVDRIDGVKMETPFPHVIYKIPGHHHVYHASDHREAVFFIYSQSVTRKLQKAGFVPENMLQPLIMTGELHDLINRLNSLFSAAEEYAAADKIDLTCFAILEEMLYQHRMKEDPSQSKIKKIASLLQMNLDSNTAPLQLALENGFSERSFFRHWARVFPMSPAKFILDLKMKRAAYLLTHTSLEIGEIAAELHFRSDNYFSTCFRKYYRISPRAYRHT